jgi:hypothetical protein
MLGQKRLVFKINQEEENPSTDKGSNDNPARL